MSKKLTVSIIFLILFGMFITGCGLIGGVKDYKTYSDAFKKTFGVDSMELNTSVKASFDGESEISSTGTFKFKGMKSTPQFINTMIIGGSTVTQFCDGETVYTDDGTPNGKNKTPLGGGGTPENKQPQEQQQKQESAFSYDSYLSEFSSLIDAGKIKEMGSLEPVGEEFVVSIETKDVSGGKQFDVVLLPSIVSKLKSKFLNDNGSSNANSPTVVVDDNIIYSVIIKDGYVTQITFNFKLSVTAPGSDEAKKATVDLTLTPVNPGQAVSFDLPSTEGF